MVDCYTFPNSGNGKTETLAASNKSLRISYVDHENATIYVESTTASWDRPYADEDYGNFGFITVQNSRGRELCGLGAIFDSNVSELYGVNKASNAWINPIVHSCASGINDIEIYTGVKKSKDYKGAEIDLIMMGDDAFRAYQQYMRANNIVVCEKHKFVGGAVGYKVLAGSQEVVIVNERFVPKEEAWGVDTSAFMLQSTPWNFMSKDGGIFIPMADTSVYRALLASYGNLICTNPGGCVKFTNCIPTA